MTDSTYAEERVGFVQSYVRRLGIILTKTSPYHSRFMAACLAAELAYPHLFQDRESRRGGLGHPHPDTIEGPWPGPLRAVAPEPSRISPS